jgi:hypothetical protein
MILRLAILLATSVGAMALPAGDGAAQAPQGVEAICTGAGFIKGPTNESSSTRCTGATKACDTGPFDECIQVAVVQLRTRRDVQDAVRNWGPAVAGPGEIYSEQLANGGSLPFVSFARGRCYVLVNGGGGARTDKIQNQLSIARTLAQRVDAGLLALTATNVCTLPDEGANPPTATPSLGVAVVIDHIEVVQVVQDAQNSVPLVAGKKGVVRVFVRATGKNPVAGVDGTLTGTPASGPKVTLKSKGGITAPLAIDRAQAGHSLIFDLPADLTRAGALALEAKLTAPAGVAAGPAGTPGLTAQVRVSFQEQSGLAIAYMSICFPTATKCPSAAIANQASFLAKIFPIADGGVFYYPLPVPPRVWTKPLGTIPQAQRLIAAMRKAYDFTDSIDLVIADQFAAWLPDDPGISVYGISDPVWAGSTGRVTFEEDTSNVSIPNAVTGAMVIDAGSAARTFAHEVGHNLGLRHTSRLNSNTPAGGCGSTDPDTDWPTAGPGPSVRVDATIQEIGWDTERNEAVPASRFDVMSYCSPPSNGIWISPFDYKKLAQGDLQPRVQDELNTAGERRVSVSPGGPLAPRTESVAGPSEVFIVSGTARRDGTAGTLDPAYRLIQSIPAPAQVPTGNHCLRFTNGAALLSSYCFNLEFVSHQSHAATDEEAFSLKVPFPAGATKVSLTRGAKEIASLSAGNAPPTVQIRSTKSGEVWDGNTTITWASSGAPGAAISNTVLYSPDGKKTWYPLEIDTQASNTTFDAHQLQRGDNVYIRVLASDGFTTAQAEAGPVKVPNGRPPVNLKAGAAGTSTPMASGPGSGGQDSGSLNSSAGGSNGARLLGLFVVVAVAVSGGSAFAYLRRRTAATAPGGQTIEPPAIGGAPFPRQAPPGGWSCIQCGHGNAGQARFCVSCGTAASQSAIWRCASCGSESAAAARFCTVCGTRR